MQNQNNKVLLRGQIINTVRYKYDKKSAEYITYFVLAVTRQGLKTPYNYDDNNYFYCYGSEKVIGLSYCQDMKSKLSMYDMVEIEGMLENRINPQKQLKCKKVNFRALSGYISTICIVSYKKYKVDETLKNKQIKIINSVRKTFGKNVNVEVSADAFDKDTFGIELDNMPDF